MAIEIPELELTTAYRAKDYDDRQQLFVVQRYLNPMWAVKESCHDLGRYTAPGAFECFPELVVLDVAQVVLNEIHRGSFPT